MALTKEDQERIKNRWQNRNSGSSTTTTTSGGTSTGTSLLSDEDKKRISESWNKRFDVDDTYINNFFSDANTFLNGVQSAYGNLDYKTATAESSGEYYSSLRQTEDDLGNRAWRIQNYLKTRKDDIDEETYNSLSEFLNNFSSPKYSQMFYDARDYYSQWKNEDDYNYYQKYNGKSTTELDEIFAGLEDGKEKDWVTSYRSAVAYDEMSKLDTQSLQNEIDEMEAVFKEAESIAMNYGFYGEDADNDLKNQLHEVIGGYSNGKYYTIPDLEEAIAEKKQKLVQAQRIQDGIKMASVADPNSELYDPEFSKYTGYTGSTYIDNGWNRFFSWDESVNLKSGYEDIRYDFINNPDEMMMHISKTQGEDADRLLTALKPYTHMDKSQVATYNYYYAKHGREAADKYLDSIQESLNMVEGEALGKRVIENPLLKYTFFVNAGLDQFVSGAQGLWNSVKGNEEYTPVTTTQVASGVVREDLKDVDLKYYNFKEGEWDDAKIFGSSLGQTVYDLGTTTVNMAPSILASSVVGMLNPAAGAVVGNALMGGTAAGNAYTDAINRGFGKDEARTYGISIGVSEALLQQALGGIGKLGGASTKITKAVAGIDNALLRWSLQYGGKFASEALEEGLQEILDPIFQNAILHADEDINWSEVAYSALLGGLSAGTLELGGTIKQTSVEQALKKKYDGKTDSLIQEGLESDINSESYELATRYKAKTDSGKALTGAEIRQLLAANQEQITPKDLKKIQQAAEKRLTDLGQTEDVAKIAELATKRATGHELTRAEKSLLANSQYGARVANELLPQNIESGGYTTEWAEGIGTKKVNKDAYNITQKKIAAILEEMAKAEDPATYKSLEERVSAEEKLSVSNTGQATIRATGKAIDMGNVEVGTIKDGKMTLKVDGKEVSVEEIDFANEDQSYLVSAVSKIENITPGAATFIIRGYDSSSNQTVGEYLNGIDEAYTYGYYGYNEADLKAGNFTTKLTDEQMMSAYKLGQSAKKISNETKTETIKRMRTAVEAEVEKAKAEGKEAPKPKQMTITYRDKSGKVASIDKTGITDAKQSGGVKVAQILHKLGLGTNFEFFTSYESKTMKVKDKKTGEVKPARVYINENGIETVAPAGVYRMSDGTIRIDLEAYNGRKLTLNALAHELTHFIQQWSDAKYKVLANFLMKTYEKTDMTMHERVLREQARLEEIRGEEVSYNEAYDEVVANAMMKMFDDGKLVERLTELKATDEKLAKKLWQGFKKILSKFLGVYQNESALFHDTNDLMQMKDTFEQLQNLFAEALVEASENFQASLTVAESQTLTEAGIGFDENTKSVYSLNFSTAYQDEIQVGKKTFNTEAIAQVVAKGTGRSIEDARKWVQSELTIANIVMQNPEFLDFEADNRYEAIKKNSDYPQGTVDLSNLCPKREEFTAMFDMLQKKYPNKLFTAQDVAEMRKILSDNDITVACGACFVEDRRQLIGEIADTYIQMWKEAVETGKPLQKTNAAGQKIDLLVTKALAKQYGLTQGTKIMATDTYIPNQYDLTTYEGFKLLEKNHPTIAMGFNRYNNSRGQQSARLIEGRAEYNRQILGWSDAKVRSVNNNGGLRIFSFSDFEVVHLLDLVQVIIDCSARGVKIQGYTKIPAFAKLVRDTGAKLNRSIIPKGDYGFHMENGKVVLDYDTTEGIDINDKNFVDESDNPNVGNVIIGINPTQIGAAMLEPFIDYIIPFHSNKSEAILKKLGTGEWVNYKTSQHEKDISTGTSSKHNVNIYTEVINKYHPTNKVEFVEAFLKECKRQGKIPRYAEFLNVDANGDYAYREGYHKLLVDFKMFDKDGNILPQGDIVPNLDENFMKELLNAEIDRKQNYEFPQEVYDAIDKKFGEQYASQETDADRQQYNPFREKFTKERLDLLSDRLGKLFPLSAGFEQAIQNDKTPVSNMTIVANSQKRNNGESFYTVAKKAFKKLYGAKTTFSIKQLGINADADDSFARESIAKASDRKDMQTILDLTPAFKQLIEDSRLLAVERLIHNDKKEKSLLCYRLYNAYIREETYIDANGKKQTQKVPHIVVFSVIQNLADAKAYMVTDIKDVAISNGHNSSKLKAAHANGNISIANIADVYGVVKSIDRKKGGLRYSPGEMAYKFDYTQKESGEVYSSQETDLDSNGKQLGEDQIEYFENSKVRDRNGRLQVVYHGGTVEFEFDTTRGGKGATQYGPGAYFTDSEYYAKEYTWYRGGDVKDYYLNIEKMFDDTNMDATGKMPEWKKLEQILWNNGIEEKFINKFKENGFAYMSRYLALKAGAKTSSSWEGSEQLNTMLREAGFDGIKGYLNDVYQYAIFTPNQAKLTTNEVPSTFYDTRYSSQETDLDVGYHAGDLGKSESLRQQGLGRDTGHFGTGTYFVGNKASIDGYNTRDGKPAPVETVNFGKYNLFKPKNAQDGFILHDFLRGVDGYWNRDTDAVNTMEEYEILQEKLSELVYDIESEEFGETDPSKESWMAVEREFMSDAKRMMGDYKVGKELTDTLNRLTDGNYQYDSRNGEYYSYDFNTNQFTTYSEDEIIQKLNAEEGGWKAFEGIVKLADDYYSYSRTSRYESWTDSIKDVAKVLGISEQQVRNVFQSVTEDIISRGYTDADMQTADSAATRFMKALGYEGIDVRGIKGLDNTSYGSVIYDLKGEDLARKKAIGTARYSTQETDNISNRDLLANAFESISRSSIEYEMIQDYKGMVSTLNKLDNELADINAEIRKIRFGTEGARDMEALRKLEEKANRIARDINKYDKRLLNMEASEPLRKVIERERKKEAQKTKAHVKEIQKNKKARAEQTELRHKIRKTVRDLDKILNRGNKKQNVKEDMQSFVSKALELADYLFTDHVSNDDLIRKGITVRMTAREEALVKETQDILTQLYDNADSLTDEEFARLDAKRKANEDKLRDLLTAQRNERLNTPVYNLFNDLVTEYAALKNSNQEAVKGAYDPKVEEFLRSYLGENVDGTDSDRKTLLQNMRVADMTTEELWKLYNAYTMVLHSVRMANKLFVSGKLESLDQTVEAIVSDFGKRKIPEGKVAIAIRNIANKIGWEYEKLYYALDRIGSDAFTELIMNIANSENTVMQDIIEAAAYRDEIVKNYGFNNWDVNKKIDKEFLDNTGKKFNLTLGQIMSLYAYSRREGAWDHIEYGGFVFGEKALTDPRPADSYKLSKEQCEAITNTLTKEQKAYVEDMQKFLSETMGAKGNEVSMLLYGIKMFGEKNYFPIHIAGQYKAQANESQAKAAAGFATMSNAGFTHAQNPNAKAPFVLEGFNDVWSDHVNEMSRYHGTVPALEDLRRVMNRSSYSDAYAESMSVKAMMENAFGQDAVDYFDNLYREANSGAIQDKMQRIPKKLLSLFRKNSVAYSLSVVIQQPSAMARAYAMIDKKYFGFKGFGALTSGIAKAVSSKWNPAYTNAYNEMLKYAPGVTMAKEIGGFDTHTGTSIREYLLDTGKSFKQSMKTENLAGKGKAVMGLVDDNAIANLPTVADKIAWIEIWNACKKETVAKHKDLATNSDEFMKIVGDRFTEVIRATQVYDSMFSKSPMLKSKNLAVQYLVSFMNEPNTTANMVEKAVRDATKGNWKGGLRIATAVTYSIIFNNVLKAMVYAMRDDDEDETYIEKYLSAVAGGIVNDFNPLTYIPVVKDAWSKVQGYDLEMPYMAVISDAVDAWKALGKLMDKDTDSMTDVEIAELDKKMSDASWKLVGSIAAFFGIPVKNIYREIEGVIDHARIASKNAGMTTADSLWDRITEEVLGSFVMEDKVDKLYDAIVSGDTKYIERIKGTYKTDDAYTSAVRKALRENDPRIHEAAQARYDGNTEEYKRIFREIQKEGKFTFDDIMSAINSEESAIKKGVEPEKATSDYTANGYVEAIAMGNSTEAQAMKDDIIATKVANGKTQEEAEKEFASAVATGIRDAYSSGLLDKAGAEKMLMEYADKDEDEAVSKVNYWAFCEEHSEYKDIYTEAQVEKYHEFAEPADISVDVYAQFIEGTKGLKNIKDEWGDVELSVRDQTIEVIHSLPLTGKQKDALYLAAELAESKIWDVLW